MLPGEEVNLLLADGSVVGYATLFVRNGGFSRILHGHRLADIQKPDEDLVVVYRVTITGDRRGAYPYPFKGAEEPPRHLGDIRPGTFVAWDMNLMQSRNYRRAVLSSARQQRGPLSTLPLPRTAATRRLGGVKGGDTDVRGLHDSARRGGGKDGGTHATGPSGSRLPQTTGVGQGNVRGSATLPAGSIGDSGAMAGFRQRNAGVAPGEGGRAELRSSDEEITPVGPLRRTPGVANTKKAPATPSMPSLTLPSSRRGRVGESETRMRRMAISSPHGAVGSQKQVALSVVREAETEQGNEKRGVAKSASDGDENAKALYSDDDVESVPEIDTSFVYSPVNVRDYVIEEYIIDLDLIDDPTFSARGVSENHLRELDQQLERKGLLYSSGIMSVTVRGEGRPFEGGNIENGRIVSHVDLIDGRHRRILLERRRRRSEHWKSLTDSLRVYMWTRRDGKDLSDSEILQIGITLNDTSSAVLKMRFADRVHSTVSMLGTVQVERSVAVDEVTASQLAGVLKSSEVIGKLETRQLRRFADLGVRLASMPSLLPVFEKVCETRPGIGLTHVSSDILLKLEERAFKFAMLCLKYYMGPKGPEIRGGFEIVRSYFYSRVVGFYTELKKLARICNEDVEVFSNRPITLSAGPQGISSVEKVCVEQVNRFGKVPRSDLRENTITRAVNTFRMKVMKWMPEVRELVESEGSGVRGMGGRPATVARTEEEVEHVRLGGSEEVIETSENRTPVSIPSRSGGSSNIL